MKRKTTFLTTTLILLVAANVMAADAKKKGYAPKLIIGITIDQLRSDYLYALENQLGEGGLKMLLDKGVVYEQVIFDVDNADATAAMAALATGSYAFSNGITSQEVYNTQTHKKQSIFADKDFLGNFTDGNYSAKALNSTTLADELMIASDNTSRVFSIAADPEAAILGAGHSGSCALWIDDKQGKWAGTTYYKLFPNYLERKNKDKPLAYHLSEAVWEPIGQSGQLAVMPYHYETKGFSHVFYQYGQPDYQWFKSSPLVNDAIVELSKFIIDTGALGNGKNTDMLQLSLYCGTWLHDCPEKYAEELQDIYLRVDRSLKNLFEFVDQKIGLENTFIYLMGTGETTQLRQEIEETRVGTFTASRCTSLLNSYLVSIYGKGNYVIDMVDNQIYLDHRGIEQNNLKLNEVQQTAAEFVLMFSGVEEVVTQYQILHQDNNDRVKRMRKSYDRIHGGDLIVSFQPGWTFRQKDNSEERRQTRHDVSPAPAIIFSPGLKSQRISTPIDATCIIPTVAYALRIRAPSGCKQAPMILR